MHRASYITPLSDDPKKNEYTFVPGSKFLIHQVKKELISDKDVWVFKLMAIVE